MIDFTKERVLTLRQAAAAVPGSKGKSRHPETIRRWMENGLNGIRLETIRQGRGRCTSLEALQRFFQRLTALDCQLDQPTPMQSHSDNEAAKEELRRLYGARV